MTTPESIATKASSGQRGREGQDLYPLVGCGHQWNLHLHIDHQENELSITEK